MSEVAGFLISNEKDVTFEIWEQSRGKFGWKEPQRRHPGDRGFSQGAAQKIADGYNEEQKYQDRYQTDGSEPSRRYFVVKATTTFEEVQS